MTKTLTTIAALSTAALIAAGCGRGADGTYSTSKGYATTNTADIQDGSTSRGLKPVVVTRTKADYDEQGVKNAEFSVISRTPGTYVSFQGTRLAEDIALDGRLLPRSHRDWTRDADSYTESPAADNPIFSYVLNLDNSGGIHVNMGEELVRSRLILNRERLESITQNKNMTTQEAIAALADTRKSIVVDGVKFDALPLPSGVDYNPFGPEVAYVNPNTAFLVQDGFTRFDGTEETKLMLDGVFYIPVDNTFATEEPIPASENDALKGSKEDETLGFEN